MKILLRRTDADGIRSAIRVAYRDDPQMAQIHILKGASLEEMVEYTWQQSIEDADKAGTLFYEIITPDKTVIGHTTLVLPPVRLLFTFGINIHYRNKEILLGWVKAVEGMLGKNFVLTLRMQNERAIGFFTRLGFQTKTDIDKNQVVLWRQVQ